MSVQVVQPSVVADPTKRAALEERRIPAAPDISSPVWVEEVARWPSRDEDGQAEPGTLRAAYEARYAELRALGVDRSVRHVQKGMKASRVLAYYAYLDYRSLAPQEAVRPEQQDITAESLRSDDDVAANKAMVEAIRPSFMGKADR